jgi:hypothetical protein
MGKLIGILIRAAAVIAILATSLAIAVARLVPHPRAHRTAALSRYMAINGHFFTLGQPESRVLDTQTGRVARLALPEGERLQWASFSDWVGADGERQVAGRWSKMGGTGDSTVFVGSGLGRVSYPSGRVLDSLTDLRMIPSGPPCWYPGPAARIIYAAGDGRIYQYAFDSPTRFDLPSPDDGESPISWGRLPAANDNLWVHELAWPKDPRFRGRLFAAVSRVTEVDGQCAHSPASLWWLELSADGMTVTAAGPLAGAHPGAESLFEHRFPSLTALADGTLAVVYHERVPGDGTGEARIARVEFDAETRVPQFRPSDSVRLAERCKSVPAAFEPGGAGAYLLHWTDHEGAELRRHSLGGILPPRSDAPAAP